MPTGKFLATFALLLGPIAAQQPKGGPRTFPQPAPPKEVTITAIPGIVGTGVKWQKAWQGEATADGMTGTKDGGLLMAQEQTNRINKIDKDDKESVFLSTVHGPGSVAFGPKNKVYVLERSCTDPGGKPETCTEATGISEFAPDRKVIADSLGAKGSGKSLGRINDLAVSNKGNVYFTGPGGAFWMKPSGEVTQIGKDLRTNGIVLGLDDKTLYITNGAAQQGGTPTVVVLDIQPDGSATNQREFAKLQGGGDGMAIDAKGRLFVTIPNTGVQVIDTNGMTLGMIPTPRSPITLAFSGKDKKWLYVGTMGITKADGKEFLTADGVRNTAMTVYKIPTLTQGYKGRLK